MSHESRTSRRARIEAAKARARVAMEADRARVWALKQKKAAETGKPVENHDDGDDEDEELVDESPGPQRGRLAAAKERARSYLAKVKAASQGPIPKHSRLTAARERARLAMLADLERVRAIQLKNGTLPTGPLVDDDEDELADESPIPPRVRRKDMRERTGSWAVLSERPTTSPHKASAYMDDDGDDAAMVDECSNPLCRRARAEAARERLLLLSLLLLSFIGTGFLLFTCHMQNKETSRDTDSRFNEISDSGEKCLLTPESNDSIERIRVSFPDKHETEYAIAYHVLESSFSWTIRHFLVASRNIVRIGWWSITVHPSISSGLIGAWLLRHFSNHTRRSRTFVMAAHGTAGLGWTLMSIYPFFTSGLIAVLLLLVVGLKLRRS